MSAWTLFENLSSKLLRHEVFVQFGAFDVRGLGIPQPMWCDGAIMMAKTQITLETEMQRRARQRANDLGVSLPEYFRRLVARDLACPETAAHVERIFDLGTSGGSDIASQKDSLIAEAFQFTRRKRRRR